jgi:Protein of unknown function (DUF3147)
MEYAIRFVAGGLLVSIFAVVGDVLNPKSFAGIFGAAPSVALATLSMTIMARGTNYAAIEARSMIVGGLAFFLYSCVSLRLMARYHMHALRAAASALVIWLACALGIWAAVWR